MNFSDFYAECLQLPEFQRPFIDQFYRTIGHVFGDSCCDFEVRDKVCRLFANNDTPISKAQYYRTQKLVRKLYDWLEAHGVVSHDFVQLVYGLRMKDVVSDIGLYRYYFKDLDVALDFVRYVGSTQGMDSFDDLLNIKTIVILSWYQVELTDMLALRKSALQPDGCSVLVAGRTITMKKEHFDILKRFAELDVHKGFPSQKRQVYIASPYLLRSAMKGQLTKNNVYKAIQRFNSISMQHGKEISIHRLKFNGIFDTVCASHDESTLNALIKAATGCDSAAAFGYKEVYRRWQQLFLGGDKH